jgi:hypothetical protein
MERIKGFFRKIIVSKKGWAVKELKTLTFFILKLLILLKTSTMLLIIILGRNFTDQVCEGFLPSQKH